MREVVQRGLYYDELEPGVVYRHRPGRTLTETDDVMFSTLTMNHQALHLDAAWAATQPFGQRLVNSMMTLSTLVGLSVGQVTQGTIVANLGFREVEFPKPVFHGDTLYAETEVLDKRLSASRPGQGVVTLEHRGRNQDGVLVARAVRTALFWTRAAHEAAVPDGAGSAAASAVPDDAGPAAASAVPDGAVPAGRSAVAEPADPGVADQVGSAQARVTGLAAPSVPHHPGGGSEPVLRAGDEEGAW